MTSRAHASLSLLAALAALSPGSALAHGGTWRADQVLVEPGNPDHVVLCSDAWGVIETKDHGKTWAWTCAEAYGAVSINLERVAVALLPGGTFFAARGFDGIFRGRGSLCDPAPLAFFAEKGRCGAGDCIAVDVTRGSDASGAVLALTTSARAAGGVANLVWHSADGGDTWAGLPDAVPSDVAATSLAVAPSDPKKLYLTSQPPGAPGARLVLHTEDGGATWEKAPPVDATVPGGDALPVLRVAGVHPTKPGVAFFWLDYADTPVTIGRDRLLMTADGGATVTDVFQAAGNLPGFAFSPDGVSVFVGGVVDGVHRAKVSDVAASGSGAFVQASSEPAFGLAVTADGLVAGHDDFGASTGPRFSLGLSHDDGATFSPLMVICDVGMQACAAGTRAGDQCPTWFSGPGNYEVDFPKGPRCTPPVTDGGSRPGAGGGAGATGGRDAAAGAGGRPGADASTPASGGASSAGCGCTVAGESRTGGWEVAALAVGLTAVGRRGSKRPRRTRASG